MRYNGTPRSENNQSSQGRNSLHTSEKVALASALNRRSGRAGFGADNLVRVWHTQPSRKRSKHFNDIARRFEAKKSGIKMKRDGLDGPRRQIWHRLRRIAAGMVARPADHLPGLNRKACLARLDEVLKASARTTSGAGQAVLQCRRQAIRPRATLAGRRC